MLPIGTWTVLMGQVLTLGVDMMNLLLSFVCCTSFFFLIIHSSKAPYQCSQEGQPNIHLDTHIPGQWSVGRPGGDADMGTPCQKKASQ